VGSLKGRTEDNSVNPGMLSTSSCASDVTSTFSDEFSVVLKELLDLSSSDSITGPVGADSLLELGTNSFSTDSTSGESVSIVFEGGISFSITFNAVTIGGGPICSDGAEGNSWSASFEVFTVIPISGSSFEDPN
jgi:hypothetical protein